MKNKIISEKNLLDYKKYGYFLIKNFYNEKKIHQIKKEIIQHVNKEQKDIKRGELYYEFKGSRKILRRLEKVSETFISAKNILENKKLLKIISFLLKGRSMLFKDKLNFKLPGGKGFEPHIDGHFSWKDKNKKLQKGWKVYANDFLNVVIPLEKTNKSNGCIYLSDLASTRKYLGNNWNKINNKLESLTPKVKKKYLKSFKFKAIEQNPGDILFFNWKNVHLSKKNNTNKSRMIFYGTFAKKNKSKKNIRSKYYADKSDSKNPLAYKSIN